MYCNTLTISQTSLAGPDLPPTQPLVSRTLLASLAPVAILFTGLALGPGCADTTSVGAPVDLPHQIIEAGVSDDGRDMILSAADLDPAMAMADFHIYNANPPQLDLDLDLAAANCGLRDRGVIPSDCGVCKCMPDEGIVCVDYSCDPAALTFDPTDATTQSELDERLRHRPLSCSNDTFPGESWMQDCNVCTCLGDGAIGCTLMACGPRT